MKKLCFFGGFLLLGFLGGCSDSAPQPPYSEYEVVKVETTVNSNSANPLPRWILRKVPLDSLPGFNGKKYAEVKAFGLADTIAYRPGSRVLIESELLGYAQQTRWQTRYEWLATTQHPPGYVPNPELRVIRVVPR